MPHFPRLLTALALAASLGTPLRAETEDAGAYLAARVAEARNDFKAATAWYGKAILSDGGDARLLEGAVLAEIGSGDFPLAIEAAGRLKALGGEPNQVAEVALLADQAQREDYAAILAGIEAGSPLGDLVTRLVGAWAKVGEGKMSEALAAFDDITKTKGFEAFGYYHKALALASVGDFEGADEILSGRAAGPIFVMRRGIFAHAEILSQLERNADALALLDRSFGTEPDPLVDALRRRLEAGEPVPFQTVRTARDGIAEVFYSVGTALNRDADPVYTLLHLRVASYLRPDHSVLFFYRGIVQEQSKDWAPAEADFRKALSLNPTQPQVLNYLGYGLVDRGEKLDEALGMIRKAVAGDPEKGYIIDSLAWALFKLGRYDEALEPMEKASLLEPVDPIVTDHLGDVYWMVGRKLEARFQWRRALSFEPTE